MRDLCTRLLVHRSRSSIGLASPVFCQRQLFVPIRSLVNNFSSRLSLYAKNKAKKGSSSISSDTQGDEEQQFDRSKLEASCDKVIKKLQKEIQDLKAGRQNPNILNSLKVPAENATLSQLAAVSQKNPKTFIVTVFDPAHVKHISSAIASSGQNLNPQSVPNNPTQLVINIPKDSASAKVEKVKSLQQTAEQARIQIRSIRGDTLKSIKKNGGSTDERRNDEKTVGTIIDKFGKDIDNSAMSAKKDLES